MVVFAVSHQLCFISPCSPFVFTCPFSACHYEYHRFFIYCLWQKAYVFEIKTINQALVFLLLVNLSLTRWSANFLFLHFQKPNGGCGRVQWTNWIHPKKNLQPSLLCTKTCREVSRDEMRPSCREDVLQDVKLWALIGQEWQDLV